jgi:hypothetical protein
MSAVVVVLVIFLILAGLGALYMGGVLKFNVKTETGTAGDTSGDTSGDTRTAGANGSNDTTGGDVFGDETEEGDYEEFPDGFEEAPVLPPRKKSLGEACVEHSECNRGLDCRVANEDGDKQCLLRVNMEDLPGADQMQVPGTELGTISTGDKFMIRNRHKGRCLGKNDDDRLVHSEVGPKGETIPCDAEDPDFQWENLNIPGTNKKKFRIVDTNLCLALDGRLNVTSSFPNGRWASQSNFSLVSCDRPNKATAVEVVPEPEESGVVNGQEFVPARYYALKTYSTEVAERPGTRPGCLWMPGWHPNNAQTSYVVSRCDRSRKNDTMHFNFPKIE